MDVNNLKTITKNINKIDEILGKLDEKKVLQSELKSRKFARRSIVVKRFKKSNNQK